MSDVPRGRPRIQETADDIVASVLATAGARVGTSDFSTRRVAALTGLSQPVVARSFARIRTGGSPPGHAAGVPREGTPPPRAAALSRASPPLELAEFRVAFPRIRIRFRPAASPAAPGEARAAQRRAAAVMAALWVSGAADWRAAGTGTTGEAPTTRAADGSSVRAGEEPEALWDPDGGGTWPEFLAAAGHALQRCAPSLEAIPGDLLRLLASRAGRGLHGVDWRRGMARKRAANSESDVLAVPEFPAPQQGPPGTDRRGPGRWLPRQQLSVTEQIAIALRKEIMNAGFRAGDRISPAPLAAHMGLPAGTVRSAMGRLADDGLLAVTTRGFGVPAVTGADVIDLYAARLHVGMVLIRALAARPRHHLLPARLALRAVEAAAAQGTSADVDQADLHFQQELADASGLGQSSRSFHALTLRVRMFISVLQLDYSPAVDRIVSDDRRLLAAVAAGRTEEALRVWRGKLDNAVRHMSALSPESFDADLWERLSR
ncbi:GntR family transcriptional regulator [Sediminivirga luteola]|uniref:HTH gntR-type domain-containing protein n=1 Tax=Sediminivirga luteola TaxID=1774748 RepID=A0A8J2XIU5_9MICO|nr:GntR family transcriptional regulator [Sediminivirga luteola]MCI2265289.1 GntR family transcriptional regulator [Sediminivirga luteola]GGA04603.1 hypothetical protein GCM10011333_03880 [Sediminivirga luteola]